MVPASGGHLSGGWNQAGSFSYDLISSELLLEHDFFKIDINGWSPNTHWSRIHGKCVGEKGQNWGKFLG